jgi:hypothetical protein
MLAEITGTYFVHPYHEFTFKVKSKKRIRHKLKLTKNRFKAFRKQWDAQASEDASEDWDALIIEQGRGEEGTVLEPDIEKEGSESAEESVSMEAQVETTALCEGDIDEEPASSSLAKRPRIAAAVIPAATNVPRSERSGGLFVPPPSDHPSALTRHNLESHDMAEPADGVEGLNKFHLTYRV